MWSNISSYSKSSLSTSSEKTNSTSECFSSPTNDQLINNNSSQLMKSEDEEQQQEFGSPLMRYKHAICSTSSGHIYIHGGRFGNLPLDDDMWRFDPHHNTWLQLKTTGYKPPNLQEHTLVEYNDRLYLFGGQVCASNNENSFWSLNLATNEWQSLSLKNSKFGGAYLGPKNKRGHSAVIYKDSMYIFGGFEDFRGSSAQLWEYDLINKRWELRNLSSTSACHPEARHSHSAIVYKDSMYIYGGLSDLKPLSDLWCWSWKEKRWFKERTKGTSPGQLHGHSAIQAFGSMFVFGGERNGRTTRSLWRLNLSNLTWQKIRPKGPKPMPTTWHGAIANPLSILDEANYIVQGCADDTKLFFQKSNSIGMNNQQQQHLTDYNQHHQDQLINDLPVQQNNGCTKFEQNNDVDMMNSNSKQTTTLKHSVSTNIVVATQNNNNQEYQTFQSHNGNTNGNNQYRKRKSSRLSFLKKKTRPKSTYELKQLYNSVSANDFKISTTTTTRNLNNMMNQKISVKNNPYDVKAQRHSIAIEQPSKIKVEKDDIKMEDDKLTITTTQEREVVVLGNEKIFDNLETDINQMFQQIDNEVVELEPMSIDDDLNTIQPSTHQQQQQQQTSGNSQTYQTAVQNITSQDNSLITKSQRTSYAYTTPPSEANTLKGAEMEGFESQQTINNNHAREQLSTLNEALDNIVSKSSYPTTNYRRTENNQRPKSEIVQSLIERADARIKHLYTPFFNQPLKNNNNNENIFTSSTPSSSTAAASTIPSASVPDKAKINENENKLNKIMNNQQQRKNYRHSLDRSKRHTIHQTTTFYNLYFSEDKSSSSPTTSDSNNNSNDNQMQQQTSEENEYEDDLNLEDDINNIRQLSRTTMKCDDSSSNTIKGSLYTSGNLIGIRGSAVSSSSDHSNQVDQVSQLSLEATNSDSRTLCGDISQSSAPIESTSTTTSYISSIPNALTTGGRLETTKESAGGAGDNTSLSFSVIAEFEEDDMLQYSSPTEPIISQPNNYDNNSTMQSETINYHSNSNNLKPFKGTYETLIQQQRSPPNNNNNMDITNQDNNNITMIAAHKSASSGYNSINGDQQSSIIQLNNQHNQSPNKVAKHNIEQLYQNNNNNNSHSERSQGEESSVRTDSSLGFTDQPETSPEQSGMKNNSLEQYIRRKTKAGTRRMLYHKKNNTTTTTSSTTADSLVSANYDLSHSYDTTNHNDDHHHVMATCHDNQAPTKCLPSSPPSASSELTVSSIRRQLQPMANTLSQSRTSFMSRLTGKRKSKDRYWQLCMFVIGGKQGGVHGANEPITIWRLYI